MVELNLFDTQGGGIKRMFETQRRRSFPMPDYDLSAPGQVAASLSGRILDERYTRPLMERTDLDLGQVMLLDRVQKGQRIDRDEHRRLKSAGLVEGRYPNLIVAGAVAKATGEAGRHIRERGFNQQYSLDLILALVREHGPVGCEEIDQLLFAQAPGSPHRTAESSEDQQPPPEASPSREHQQSRQSAPASVGVGRADRGRWGAMKKLRNWVEKRCSEAPISSQTIKNQWLVALLRRAVRSYSSKGFGKASLKGTLAKRREGYSMPARAPAGRSSPSPASTSTVARKRPKPRSTAFRPTRSPTRSSRTRTAS